MIFDVGGTDTPRRHGAVGLCSSVTARCDGSSEVCCSIVVGGLCGARRGARQGAEGRTRTSGTLQWCPCFVSVCAGANHFTGRLLAGWGLAKVIFYLWALGLTQSSSRLLLSQSLQTS